MSSIDRITPTLRPRRWAIMRQTWGELLFLHWAVPADGLRPLIPAELDLDLFEGRAYVGLVAFTMRRVRPVGVPPIWGLSTFHETNVRTYVHHMGRDPGVWFFSLDAASRLAVWAARRWFHLPYNHARMVVARESERSTVGPRDLSYTGARCTAGREPAAYHFRATPAGPVRTARVGTLEHFLTERYTLYSQYGGRLFQGQVHHAPYPLQSAVVHSVDETLLAAAGIDRPAAAPIAHFASGVGVKVYALRSLGPMLRTTDLGCVSHPESR
jgi:uncharacterized protein YqjF (DUF2071 family)